MNPSSIHRNNQNGDAAELWVSQHLLKKGLDVFRNVCSAGPADIAVFNRNTGKTILIDVKSQVNVYVKKDGTQILNQKVYLRDDGVWQIMYVHGEDCVRVPEGFWEALEYESS